MEIVTLSTDPVDYRPEKKNTMNLDTVQVGDALVLEYTHTDKRIVIVSRVTKTQILIGPSRYRKQDGRLVGGGIWAHTQIRRPKNSQELQDIQDEQRRQKLAHRVADKCAHHKIRDLPLDALERLHTVVEEVCD